MKILLVNPFHARLVAKTGRIYNRTWPPLDLATTAALLRGLGLDVSILDANALQLSPVETGRRCAGFDKVFITSTSLDRWQWETNLEMDQRGITGEVARDRWQAGLAREFILQHPWRFVRASLYRGLTFWSIWPGRSAETGVPVPILWMIAAGYAALWVGGIAATLRVCWNGQWRLLSPVFCLILGYAAIHLVYWTDGRMRAPIMPARAVLVAVGLGRRTTREGGRSSC